MTLSDVYIVKTKGEESHSSTFNGTSDCIEVDNRVWAARKAHVE